MTIPITLRIGALVLATTAFYSYVGQMVPQSEVQPPEAIVIRADLTTPEMVEIGREIADGKGLCRTCHTIGQTGALRFPDLSGVAARANSRVPGLSDVEYFAQSMYEPDSYIVEGFNSGMPVMNMPPIGLTDEEILVVIAYLQSLGGTPTVTLQTAHRYYTPEAAEPPADAPAAEGALAAEGAAPGVPPAQGAAPSVPPAQGTTPGAAPPAAAPPAQGTAPGVPPAQGATRGAALAPAAPPRGLLLRPDTASHDMRDANAGDTGMSRTVLAAAGVPPVRPLCGSQREFGTRSWDHNGLGARSAPKKPCARGVATRWKVTR